MLWVALGKRDISTFHKKEAEGQLNLAYINVFQCIVPILYIEARQEEVLSL